MKIYVVGGDDNYVNFIENVQLVDKLEDAQLVVFTAEKMLPLLFMDAGSIEPLIPTLEETRKKKLSLIR